MGNIFVIRELLAAEELVLVVVGQRCSSKW